MILLSCFTISVHAQYSINVSKYKDYSRKKLNSFEALKVYRTMTLELQNLSALYRILFRAQKEDLIT